MAPWLTSDPSKNSKMTFKCLWSKFKPSKEKIKEDTGHDYVFDSTPDYFCGNNPAKGSEQQPNQPNNTFNKKTTSKNEHCAEESDEETTKDEDFTSEKKREKKETRRNKGSKSKESKDSGISVNIENCSGPFHVGPQITTHYIQQNYNEGAPKNGAKPRKPVKPPVTPEIEVVLQSDVKLGRDHTQFLSDHFGKSYREVGLLLELTNGQIDKIEINSGKDLGKMSFEIMNSWMRRNGDIATVGKLCVTLWDSKIPRAWEAVKVFSENFENFN